MYKWILLLLAICMASCHTYNPGIVAGFKLPIVERVKNYYFHRIMTSLKDMVIPDIETGYLRISNIDVRVLNKNHENAKLTFNEEENGIHFAMNHTDIKISIRWRYKLLIFDVDGSAGIKGPIQHVGFLLKFDTQTKDDHQIPKVFVENFDLEIHHDTLDIDFVCSVCPDEIVSFIMNRLKGQLIDNVIHYSKGMIARRITKAINKIFMKRYPVTKRIDKLHSIGLATPRPIRVKENHISVSIDGTIFLTEQGYSRPFEAPDIPMENLDNPGEFTLFMSSYVFQWMDDVTTKFPRYQNISLMGYKAPMLLDGSKIPVKFSSYRNSLNINFGGEMYIKELDIDLIFEFFGDYDIEIQPGDAKKLIYFMPDLREETLKIKTLEIRYQFLIFDFSWLIPEVHTALLWIWKYSEFKPYYSGKLRKFPFMMKNGTIEFQDTYVELGADIEFEHFKNKNS